MYSAVLQAQTALGGIMQRGLGIQIDSVKCLEPTSWNKLEIPERLNGEGIAVAIMAQQGGYLLFISDDGILLPAGYGATLTDPTQPLPVMANQLQKELQPDAPDYVGKRIGKAKVFSSMARRAGVDNSAQILPIKLVIGGQESLIWFIGSVPHPDRAFAKRNPNPELKSKKSKLFSDEILANFTVSSDILNPLPDSSQPTEETTEFLDESSSEINNKSERHKADLGRLLALKSAAVEDKDWRPTSSLNVESQKDIFTLPAIDEDKEEEEEDEEQESLTEQELASTVQSSLITQSCPIDVEQDVVIVQGEPVPEGVIPECITSEDVIPEETTQEKDSQEDEVVDDLPEEPVSEDVDSEETPDLWDQDDAKRYTVHPAHADYPTVHRKPPISSHPALKMPVSLDAVISQRRCMVQDILSWKPGSVIEFDDIQPTVLLESNGVVLGHGKPIEQNMRIGIQLE